MESIIKVKVGTSFDRHESAPISVDTTTPRQLLDQFGVDYHVGQTNFNGIALGEENLDKPIRWFASTCSTSPSRITPAAAKSAA